MNKIETLSTETNQISQGKQDVGMILTDLKSLFKGLVLVLNVLPVVVGFWLAIYFTTGTFSGQWETFFLTIIGSTLVMAGALALNNWYEVDLDQKMERTQARPTVTGNFNMKTVLYIGIGLSAAGMLLLLFTTLEAAVYGLIGWFTYVVLYTFWSKRKYTLNTIIGSVSGAVTPLIGWAAVDSAFHIVPITLALIIFVWQVPHTFAIAIKRHDEYKAAGVPMLPVVYGFDITKRQMLIYIIALFPLPFFVVGQIGGLFAAVASVLNIAWIMLSVKGFKAKDNRAWAQRMFIYSLAYLTTVLLLMFIVTVPSFS
ncbi:Heme o synthase [Lentibacillus sp. JNUCC-1]|uniref:heme o synthase n=1 Tax=Lentibacillus sp. JNUCC-1 TaxID=2654513 RepID=UPI0012E706BC|nr:heme o synthase [Lentibacillus sp. JNUCC-1]MUV38633.1 Heme o synthase [Lentibacillus sp. JNUCC-1]